MIFIRTYLVNRNDFWDMVEARENFFSEHCPDLLENRRPGTLIKDIGLDLPDMLIEVEVVAALGKNDAHLSSSEALQAK
ncbi:MAG: hypothetical protein ABSC55_11355 [Syntrophorhabdales bacterium]|jgi:enamine deaminase RidA (YjgF/YER057c/UK114 family)